MDDENFKNRLKAGRIIGLLLILGPFFGVGLGLIVNGYRGSGISVLLVGLLLFLSRGKGKQCYFCEERMPKKSITCPFCGCGHDSSPGNTIKCVNCVKDVPVEATNCPYCWHHFPEGPNIHENEVDSDEFLSIYMETLLDPHCRDALRSMLKASENNFTAREMVCLKHLLGKYESNEVFLNEIKKIAESKTTDEEVIVLEKQLKILKSVLAEKDTPIQKT